MIVYLISAILIFNSLIPGVVSHASPMIIADGVVQATIIISPDAGRTTRLAAQELQDGVRKMTGARLPIAFEPTDGAVRLYVGESQWTRELGVTASGLEAGAYRIVSGEDWLVLIGDDTLFEPKEPWGRTQGQIGSGELQRQWEEVSGMILGAPDKPAMQVRKHQWRSLPADLGLPDDVEVAAGETLTMWDFDEHGSFNAVCGWLYSLGMRWYMPGELGEVVPQLTSIPLEQVDETVMPDFPFRRAHIRAAVLGHDATLWARRIGLRDEPYLITDHGLQPMTGRQEVFDAHPEWFAKYGGERSFDPNHSNHLCYSNPELLEATVEYVRMIFDVYDAKGVSVMPPDGYGRICECELCEGKESPELGDRGLHSNYVWEFVNEVAKRVAETHPGKMITNCAYNRYTAPPSSIDKLEPNVQVVLVGARQATHNKPEQMEARRQWREAWYEKTNNPILTYQSGPRTGGFYLPAYTATSIGETLNELKGRSDGEDLVLSVGADFATKDIGFNHFTLYFTARMQWGGKDADVRKLLREYCDLFYGPAGDTMLEFFDYCEANWQEMTKDKDTTARALELFDSALATVQPGSVYAQRLALVDDYLQALRRLGKQLGQVRGPIPTLRTAYRRIGPINIDGILDEDEWTKDPPAPTASLREMQSGRVPTFSTIVKTIFIGNRLYIAVRCEEPAGHPLNITTTEAGDTAIMEGDCVQFLIETESRSFYQIVVNPAGAVVDFDHSAGAEAAARWNSQVEVATKIADDHWTIELSVPFTDDENDPLNEMIGRKPGASMPWFINFIRQRVRPDGVEYSAFSPMGSLEAYNTMHFGRLFHGRHTPYEAAEPEYGFIQALAKANELNRNKHYEAAVDVLVEKVATDVTDYQRALALAEAVRFARAAGNNERAAELLQRIPIAAVQHTVEMEMLLDDGQPDALVEHFGTASIQDWPFWQRGDAYRLRARARAQTGDTEGAVADYQESLIWTNDRQQRVLALYQLERLINAQTTILETTEN